MTKLVQYAALVIAVVALAVALTGGETVVQKLDLGGVTNFDSLTLSEDLVVEGATAVEGFTKGGAATVLTDANGGTYTLTQAELEAAGVLEFAAGGAGQATIALTMPATSTMTTLIPNAGDCRTWLYDASALAAATTTTLTAGTGHNIIAYTTNDDVIDGAEFAQIQMCRKSNSDVNTIVTELLHAD